MSCSKDGGGGPKGKVSWCRESSIGTIDFVDVIVLDVIIELLGSSSKVGK